MEENNENKETTDTDITEAETKRRTIKEWDINDRPRERMQRSGPKSLTNAELLGILIGFGTPKKSAVDIGRDIMNSINDDLYRLIEMDIPDLEKMEGIGQAKAVTIKAALELARRRAECVAPPKKSVQCSKDIYDFFKFELGELEHEELWVMFMSQSNTFIKKMKFSEGGMTNTVFDVRLIMREALYTKKCAALALAHNHPSGNITPSNDDKNITKQLKDACHLMGFRLLDHIIVGENSYLSFVDENLL